MASVLGVPPPSLDCARGVDVVCIDDPDEDGTRGGLFAPPPGVCPALLACNRGVTTSIKAPNSSPIPLLESGIGTWDASILPRLLARSVAHEANALTLRFATPQHSHHQP